MVTTTKERCWPWGCQNSVRRHVTIRSKHEVYRYIGSLDGSVLGMASIPLTAIRSMRGARAVHRLWQNARTPSVKVWGKVLGSSTLLGTIH